MSSNDSMFKTILSWIINKLSFITDPRFLKIAAFIALLKIISFIKKYRQQQKIKTASFQPRFLIIGAGFSGINAAVNIKTKLHSNNFVIYERDADVGGTWFANAYPGCQCDVPGLNYSLSHDKPKHWIPNYYPTQKETLEYEKNICKKYKLYQHIKFHSTVTQMTYDENNKIWNVTITNKNTNEKNVVQANIVISGVGILAEKKIPKFTNMDKYKGNSFHSCEWDQKYDFTNKNVAVIGTGPTAIQVVPSLGKTNLKKLYVFQRSISHVVPKLEATKYTIPFWNIVFTCLPFMHYVSRCYQYLWAEFLFYPGLKIGSKRGAVLEAACEAYREQCFANNSELLEKTKPRNIFGKRICLSSHYFQTYAQSNCEVITDTIEQFTENGIMIKNKNGENEEIKVDCIVYCTGFRTQEFLCSIKDGIVGKNGKCLQKDVWQTNNCFAYLGITVSGFPNLFMLYGPGTNLVHNSVLFMIECSMGYSVKCIRKMMLEQKKEIDVKKEAMDEFVKRLDEENEGNAFQRCTVSNWYKNDKGRGSTNWAWSCNYYWWMTRSVKWNHFNMT